MYGSMSAAMSVDADRHGHRAAGDRIRPDASTGALQVLLASPEFAIQK